MHFLGTAKVHRRWQVIGMVGIQHKELWFGRQLRNGESLSLPPEAKGHQQGDDKPKLGDFVFVKEQIDGLRTFHKDG